MNIDDAVKVLNEHKHCNADWSVEIGLNGPLVVGVVRGEHGRWKADHDQFDAIAIAEKLERDGPNKICGGCRAYADECACPSLAAEVALVLEQLDHLAEVFGDEGVFRRCRDHLRAAIAKERERSNA